MFDKIFQYATTKNQLSKLEQLQKKFKYTKFGEMEKLLLLTYDFFIAGNEPAFNFCMRVIFDAGFPDNTAICGVVRSAYCLDYYLSDSQKQQKIHDLLIEEVYLPSKKPCSDEKIKIAIDKAVSNMLSEDYLANVIKEYLNPRNTPKEKFESGLILLDKKLTILAFHPNVPNDKQLLSDIAKIINELRELFPTINRLI